MSQSINVTIKTAGHTNFCEGLKAYVRKFKKANKIPNQKNADGYSIDVWPNEIFLRVSNSERMMKFIGELAKFQPNLYLHCQDLTSTIDIYADTAKKVGKNVYVADVNGQWGEYATDWVSDGHQWIRVKETTNNDIQVFVYEED